jgi:hypothetical protein
MRLIQSVSLMLISSACCLADYAPISGALLDYWLDPSPGYIPTVSDVDTLQLPADVYELRIVCMEVGEDSLDIFLLGLLPETDIPLLLASGGYRGLYNLAKMVASYHPGEDAIHVAFQMPYSATFLFGDYRWNRESQALELLRYSFGDPSRDSMDRVDSLLAAGGIAEAVEELGNMVYPSAYFNSDEMIGRLLRAIDREALEVYAAGEGDPHAAVELYRCMDDFFCVPWEDWVTAFSDPADYLECSFSGYMGLGEYAMILNNFGFFLEQAGEPGEALIVLGKVLELDPSRMVAHLNMADVLWGLDRSIEAVEHYTVCRDMMTERDLAEQIPERVLERAGGLAANGQGRTPEEEVSRMLGMMGTLDEDVIAALLTPDQIAEVEVFIEMLRVSPEESAEVLSSMGLDFTPEEIRTMSTGSFLSKTFSGLEMEVGEATVAGSVAIVPVTMMGVEILFPLVLEDGVWVMQEL